MTNPADLNNILSNTENIIRNFNYSDLTSVFFTNSAASQSIQATPDLQSTAVQTLVTSLDPALQAMINPELKVSADLVDFGTIATQTSPIVNHIDRFVQTMSEYVDTGTQFCAADQTTIQLFQTYLTMIGN
jgi:hypothetical protein